MTRVLVPSSSAAVEQALRAAGAALARDADQIAKDVADLLAAEVPESSPDPVSREETRRTCRATLLGLLAAWRRGESTDQVEPPRELLFQMEVLARDGVPLRPFTRMCHLAHGALIDAWDAELSALPIPQGVQLAAIRTAHQLTFRWFDQLVERLTEVYTAELDRLARTPDTIRRSAVRTALTGSSVDVDALSRATGYEFRRLHVGFVLWDDTPALPGVPAAADAQPAFLAIMEALAHTLGAGPPLVVSAGSSTAWAWLGIREVPPAGAVRQAALAERRGTVALAIGDPEADLTGFRSTHEDAVAAARIAMQSGGGERVVEYRAVELASLLASDERRAARLVRRTLGVLASDEPEHQRLRDTLRVYLEEHGNRAAAARRLGVHPNTVSNRVRLCEELLPVPLSGTGSFDLQAALLLSATVGGQVLRPGA